MEISHLADHFQSSLGVRKTTLQQSDLFSGDNWILSIWQCVMAEEASLWARCDDSLPVWDTSEVKLRKFHMSMSPQSMCHTHCRKTPWKTRHCKMKLCCEAPLQSKEIHCSNIHRYLGRKISLAKYADAGISLLHHYAASCRNAACNAWFSMESSCCVFETALLLFWCKAGEVRGVFVVQEEWSAPVLGFPNSWDPLFKHGYVMTLIATTWFPN